MSRRSASSVQHRHRRTATSGCNWNHLPPGSGCQGDRFPAVHRMGRDQGVSQAPPPGPVRTRSPGRAGLVAARVRLRQCPRPQRRPLTGPSPTDHGTKGSKIHLLVDRQGLPLSVGISAANLHDSQALIPLVRGIAPIRSRCGPRRRRPGKLHGDKGYDYRFLRCWLAARGIRHRLARKGVDSSRRLGRHRWVVERTVSWLSGCRRPHRRYERKPEHFPAFTAVAATLICHPRLTQ
ncbi:IS5 family transposase [Streptomyces sp. NPDC001068]|uniref:IS5 family transposase n=1 Tax=Streptomyces sp. NPDC001068 TaxID=3364544 RepID=UPI00368225EF